MNKNNIKRKLIEDIEQSLKGKCTLTEKSCLLLNLIQLNIDLERQDKIYPIMKSYFFFHLKSVKNSAHGYDKVNLEKLNELINSLPVKQKVSFLDYCVSLVKLNHTEETLDWLLDKRHKCRAEYLWKEKSVNKKLLSILLLASSNVRNLIITIILIFFIVSLILAPSPCEQLSIFEIQYHDYSDSLFLNHIANMLTMFLDFDNDLKVSPSGFVSLLFLAMAKIIYILLIVNFIYLRLVDKLSVN